MAARASSNWRSIFYYTPIIAKCKSFGVFFVVRALKKMLLNIKAGTGCIPVPASSLPINRSGGVGGSQPSYSYSEADDMRVSFGRLAQQGFLAGFSARERSEQEKPVSAEKIPQGAFPPV
ncbi:MAG: hypothetical protein IKU70_01435 [Clostridia bacterium]|nr:hypothetical protein [Clostridia bacterium]